MIYIEDICHDGLIYIAIVTSLTKLEDSLVLTKRPKSLPNATSGHSHLEITVTVLQYLLG